MARVTVGSSIPSRIHALAAGAFVARVDSKQGERNSLAYSVRHSHVCNYPLSRLHSQELQGAVSLTNDSRRPCASQRFALAEVLRAKLEVGTDAALIGRVLLLPDWTR